MPRAKGKRNIKPTESEVQAYYALLRSAASDGDVNAAANLIAIHEQQRQQRARRRMENE